jgi:hypothetical protein
MIQPGLFRVQFRPTDSLGDFERWRGNALQGVPSYTSKIILTTTDELEDGKPYRFENFYHLADIDSMDLEKVLRAWSTPHAHITLLLYKRLNFYAHDGKEIPPSGSMIVANALTPENDAAVLQDYHNWFEQEHIHKLMAVPGWRTGSRYELVSQVGEQAEYAGPFLAVHQYDAENGLGGAEWKNSIVSEWTLKIDKRMAKRPHRRVFRVDRAVVDAKVNGGAR